MACCSATSTLRSSPRCHRRSGWRSWRRSRPSSLRPAVHLDLELRHDLCRGRRSGFGPDPVRDARALGPLVPPRVGPRRGLDADGHRSRRHGDAADAVPRVATDRGACRERPSRRGSLPRGRPRGGRSGASIDDPGCPSHRGGDVRDHPPHAILDVLAGGLLQGRRGTADRGSGGPADLSRRSSRKRERSAASSRRGSPPSSRLGVITPTWVAGPCVWLDASLVVAFGSSCSR